VYFSRMDFAKPLTRDFKAAARLLDSHGRRPRERTFERHKELSELAHELSRISKSVLFVLHT